MKPCAYCGKENEDAAALCAGCGTDAFKTTTVSPILQQGAKSAPTDIRLQDILTDPIRLFRALVITSTITYVIYFFQFLFAGRLVSQETWDALTWHSVGALVPLPPAFGWLLFLLSVAVAVGLLMFNKSARIVFAAFSAFGIVMSLLGGLQVQTAFGSFLLLLTNMADGAILVMAYTRPLSERFE